MTLLPPLELINNAALLLALAVLYDLALPVQRSQRLLPRLFYGVVIGGMGIALMLTPWPIGPGIVFDTRSILLSLTGLFFGTVPTLVAMFITAIFRFYQGGIGAWVGMFVIGASGLLGLVWRHLRRSQSDIIPWIHFYLFGIVVNGVLLLLMLLLPYPTSILVLSQIAAPILILYPIGTVLLGVLLQRQQERELTRETLRDREERLTLALNAAGMSTWDWNIVENKIVWDVYGQSNFEKGHATFSNAILSVHPDDRPAVEKTLNEAIRLKQAYQQNFRIMLPDGEVRWVAVNGQVVQHLQNKPRFIGVLKDITEQRQAETALRLSRFAVNNAAEGMVVVAHNGRLVDVNREECRRLGYSREEMLQKYVWDVDPAMSEKKWPAHWQKIKDAGQMSFNTTNVNRAGEEIYLEISVSYIKFEGEAYYYAFSRDITRQHLMERQLRQAQKMEAMGRLAGSIAHDFNNLLVPITGFAEMAMMLSAADTQQWQYLSRIKNSADRAAALTRQILAFSRNQELELEVVNVNQLIGSFMEMAPRLVRKNVHVVSDLCEEPLWIEADTSKIEQILLNLTVNASDAMPAGGDLILSTQAVYLEDPWQSGFTQLEAGNYILLSAEDTGEGIPLETIQHIFEPFFTTKKADQGTGLGLATVHGIVQQHKGDVMVTSQPGQGTRFVVALPRFAEAVPEPLPLQPSSVPRDTTLATVLVAEDDENVRLVLKETLCGLGYRVLEARDGHHALEIVEALAEPVDLLISDYAMPEINGIQLFDRLKVQISGLKVLFISGHAAESQMLQEISGKGYSFLHKPFSISDLRRAVEQLLTGP